MNLEGENGERRRCRSRARMELRLGSFCRRLRRSARRSRAGPRGRRARRPGGGPRTRSWSSKPSAGPFTAEYKARILAEADACTRPGEVGELLRGEGLYTSHLTYWRKQRRDGALKELGQSPRAQGGRQARWARSPQLTRRARACGGGAGEDEASCGNSGKRLSAAGGDARVRQRGREHRAMIEATVEELTPLMGTRPACRAVGASPATIYRRRRPPEPRPPRSRPTPARALAGPERQQGARRAALASGSSTSRRRTHAMLLDQSAYLCSTGRRTGSSRRTTAACGSGAISSPTQPYTKPELLAERPNELWSWDISKLIRAQRSGPGSTCT